MAQILYSSAYELGGKNFSVELEMKISQHATCHGYALSDVEMSTSWIGNGNLYLGQQENAFARRKRGGGNFGTNWISPDSASCSLNEWHKYRIFYNHNNRIVKYFLDDVADGECVLTSQIERQTLYLIVRNTDGTNSDPAAEIRNIEVGEDSSEISTADLFRKVGASENIFADTLRKFANKIFESVAADTERQIREFATADLIRRVKKSESAIADTAKKIPHNLKYTIQSELNTFKDYGISNFTISLNERTLSDNFQIETTKPLEINSAVRGQLLDYPFSFLAEETAQKDLLQTVKGMYDIDKLLYTQIYFSSGVVIGDNEKIFVTAGGYIAQLAKYFGLAADIKIQDFTPYHDFTGTNITYSDLLNSVFGWTSRLPQRQINVFIRGKTLHCIQRGMEENVFDISNLPHTRPTISRKLIRSLWNNPAKKKNDKDDDEPDTPNLDDYTEEEIAVPFSGTINFSDYGVSISRHYSKGLLMRETSRTDNDKLSNSSISTYSYKEIFPTGTSEISILIHKLVGDFYLDSKSNDTVTYRYDESTKRIETKTATEYFYSRTENDDLYLTEEYEKTTKIEYEYDGDKKSWILSDSETSIRQTFHTPIGNGWYGTSTYSDGEPQGSSISQGRPGNKVSPYTINEVQKTFTGNKTVITYDNPSGDGDNSERDKYNDWRDKLSPIVDTSFPVREINLLYELTNAVYWLNRKIQENISLEIISKIADGVPEIQHIIDFTERIKFNGNEYFLVSNLIKFTPRSLKQKLELVRWL